MLRLLSSLPTSIPTIAIVCLLGVSISAGGCSRETVKPDAQSPEDWEFGESRVHTVATAAPQGGRYQWQTDVTVRDIPVQDCPGDEWGSTDFRYQLALEEVSERIVHCRWYYYYNNQERESTTFLSSDGAQWTFDIFTRE